MKWWVIQIAAVLGLLLMNACKRDGKDSDKTAVLKNDGYSNGAAKTFQPGFQIGEEAAALLGPVNSGNKIANVSFFYGGVGEGSDTVQIKIYMDANGISPGSTIFSSDFVVNTSNNNMVELDLTSKNITTSSGSIWVSIVAKHGGLPSVAYDEDGTNNTSKNWIKTGGSWVKSSTLALPGDWIIRAEIGK